MSAARRLAKLESSLPPREAVLHWLGEAQRCGSLEAYLAAQLDQPSAVIPLVTVPERARAAARRAHAGEPRAAVREAERQATVDAVFLLELVLELGRVARETIRIGSLRLAALRWELRARTAEQDLGGGADRQGWAEWRAGVLDLATDLERTEAARLIVEGRYLAGWESLWPTERDVWAKLREEVAAMVSMMPAVSGARRTRRAAGEAIRKAAERSAPDEARALVELVRARTLDLLGDHAGAVAIVKRALRPRA